MPKVLGPDGTPQDIAAADLADAWKGGHVQLVGGASYHVQGIDGRVFSVPAESLHTAIDQGGKVLDDATAQALVQHRQYGGVKGAAIAAGGGALEQATLGLGEQALPSDWKESIRKASAEHPYAQMAGEVAGTAALGAATGGLGLEGGVAGLAERALAPAAERWAGAAAGRVATATAKAALEGAQFGVARSIGENAIDPTQHPLTAAHVLGEVGGDALWAGALGGGLRALGTISRRAAPEMAGPAEQAAAQAAHFEDVAAAEPAGALERAVNDGRTATAADVGRVASRAAGDLGAPASGLGARVKDFAAKAMSYASGAAESDIRPLLESDSLAALDQAEEIRTQASSDIRTHVDNILKQSRGVMEEGQRSMKRSYITAAVGDVEPEAAAQASTALMGDTLQSLRALGQDAETFGPGADIAKAYKIATRTAAHLSTAVEGGDVASQYALLDELKKDLGTYTKGAQRAARNARSFGTDALGAQQHAARAEALASLYERLRGGLEDETVWKGAAVNQRAINQAWTTQIDASRRFNRALTTVIGRDPENPWLDTTGVDPAKADSYVRNLTNPSQDLTHQAVTDYVRSTRALANSMAQQWEMPAAKQAAVAELGKSADAFGETLGRATDTLKTVNQFERVRQATTGHHGGMMALVGAAGGHAVAGPIGGLAGLAVGRLMRVANQPAETILRMARIQGMVRRGEGRISRALRGMLSGATKAQEPLPLADYGKKAALVAELSSNPTEVQQRIASRLGMVSRMSPGLAGALQTTSLAGLSMLRDKLPPTLAPDPLDPTKPPPPSPAQQEAFLRYYKAVQDPHSVVEGLQAGRVMPEGVEVMKQVYPDLFSATQRAAMAELGRRAADLTGPQRMTVAQLLDLPLPELSPDYVAARQATFAAVAAGAAQQGKPQAPKTRRNRPLTGKPLQTVADRVESGHQE